MNGFTISVSKANVNASKFIKRFNACALLDGPVLLDEEAHKKELRAIFEGNGKINMLQKVVLFLHKADCYTY